MANLREAVEEVKLCDLGYSGYSFTWSNRSTMGTPIFKHLDRFVGNEAFMGLFPNLKVRHLKWYSFDHKPIGFEINVEMQIAP